MPKSARNNPFCQSVAGRCGTLPETTKKAGVSPGLGAATSGRPQTAATLIKL
ncbi:hypothetical protein DVDV_0368 [Desulfovibrio sp. DV]|nr:hypothetical protein DVDV_0368 [Desulfovibrio sp. DV]